MNWFIAHLVGDYLVQNDWMALNKKRASFPCFVHVTLYTLSVAAFTQWPWWALVAVAVTHFVQDRTAIIAWWMKLIGQKGFMKSDRLDHATFDIIPGLGPWSIIVVDNVWHLLMLFLIGQAVHR